MPAAAEPRRSPLHPHALVYRELRFSVYPGNPLFLCYHNPETYEYEAMVAVRFLGFAKAVEGLPFTGDNVRVILSASKDGVRYLPRDASKVVLNFFVGDSPPVARGYSCDPYDLSLAPRRERPHWSHIYLIRPTAA